MNLGSDYMLNLSYMGDTQVIIGNRNIDPEEDGESNRSEYYQLKL